MLYFLFLEELRRLVIIHVDRQGDRLVEVRFSTGHLNDFSLNGFVAYVSFRVLRFHVAERGLLMLGALRMNSPNFAWKLNLKVLMFYLIFIFYGFIINISNYQKRQLQLTWF